VSLHEQVLSWRLGERTVLWQPLLGRGLAVHPETLQAIHADTMAVPLHRRLSGLGLLAHSVNDRHEAVIIRMRGVSALPQRHRLWHPLPSQPGPGGFAYGSTPLSGFTLSLWLAINDAKTISDVADQLNVSSAVVLDALALWMSPEVQAVQLRTTPLRRVDPTLLAPLSPPRPDLGRDRVGSGTDLLAYHQDAITDGSTHFDDRETTIAHGYAEPHPALNGETYGTRLACVLGDVTQDMVVAEVGCGTGELARDLSAVVSATYIRVDLSPELLRHQATVCPATHGVMGDANGLPFADASIDRLISNEILADLAAVPAQAEGVPERLERYGIPAWEHLYNLGSWRFLEEIARVLTPGGRAWVSEFGTVDAPPQETTHLDHPEVSITFAHLEAVARGVGLVPTLRPLHEWLDVDLSAVHISRPSWQAARAWSRAHGHHLRARAYTPATLAKALPEPMSPLHFVPVTEPGSSPLWGRFWGLLLEKP
jgi:SAM-dependent methyltransferase